MLGGGWGVTLQLQLVEVALARYFCCFAGDMASRREDAHGERLGWDGDFEDSSDEEAGDHQVSGWPECITEEEKRLVLLAQLIIAKRSSGDNGHLVKVHGSVQRVVGGYTVTIATPNELDDIRAKQIRDLEHDLTSGVTVTRSSVFLSDHELSPALTVFIPRQRGPVAAAVLPSPATLKQVFKMRVTLLNSLKIFVFLVALLTILFILSPS